MKKLVFIFTVLTVFTLISENTHSQPYTPLYGIHTDAGLILNYPDTVTGFVQTCAANGYSAIMYMIVSAFSVSSGGDGSMEHWFVSPTLEDSIGSTFRADHLAPFVAMADSYNMDLYVDIQSLAYVVLNPSDYPNVNKVPSADDVVAIINELADYGIDGISEEMFPPDWFQPAGDACKNRGITYIHKAISWDMGGLSTLPPKLTVFEAYQHSDIIMTEDYNMELLPPYIIGREQFPAIAKGLNKKYHIKLCTNVGCGTGSIANMENVMLLKALQFKPEYIYVMTWNKNYVDTNDFSLITSTLSQYSSNEDKPLCNVVLYLTGNEDPDTWDWWPFPIPLAAVSTGIKASGYEIITTPLPVDSADMYYIFTRGVWGNWGNPALDLPQSIMQLFDSGKPVFLQLTQNLPITTPNWKTVRAKLGIDTVKTFNIILNPDSILYGTYNGTAYPHVSPNTYLNNITSADITAQGEVLAAGTLDSITYALIIRRGNNYFINATNLDPRANFPVSHLINDGLQKPASCVITAGKQFSLFYSLDTAELHIKLPDTSANQIKWFKRDIDGVVSTGTTTYNSTIGYRDTLSEGTLLILESIQTVGMVEYPDTTDASMQQNLYIYPNPASGEFKIHPAFCGTKFKVEDAEVKIYDLLGREIPVTLIRNSEEFVIRSSNLVAGIYFLKIKTKDFSVTKKVEIIR